MSESLQDLEPEVLETEAVEQEVAQPEVEESKRKPDTSYIDYDELPETVRDKVKMRVDSDYKKLKKLERERAEEARRIRELEEKLAEANKPREVAPPTADDWYNDPELAQRRLQEHIESVKSQQNWDFEKQRREQLKQAELAQESARKQNELFDKARNAGINENELRYSAAVLMQSQISEDLANHLIEHDYGPQLINHLAKNPLELQTIANLSPYQVGVKLAEMSKTFKPNKVSRAPEPDDPITGSGVSINENPVLKGSRIF